MSRPIRILIVEDRVDDAELLIAELRMAGFDPAATRVQTEGDFLREIRQGPDIILCDHSLPVFAGGRAQELLQESGLDIPFILVSGTVGEEVAVAAMKRGATDYLLKDRLARLGTAVEQALENRRLREDRRRADEEIRRQLRELQLWYDSTVGRENRILELKKEVNQLLCELGRPARYTSTEAP